MLRPVVAARASILVTTGGARGGLPIRLPRTRAAFIPAVTRSLISEDLKFRHGADDGEHGPAHGTVGVHLILDADKAHAEMIEFFKRHQQMSGAAREPIEFPDQHAIDFMISGRRHQGIELRAALPAA